MMKEIKDGVTHWFYSEVLDVCDGTCMWNRNKLRPQMHQPGKAFWVATEATWPENWIHCDAGALREMTDEEKAQYVLEVVTND